MRLLVEVGAVCSDYEDRVFRNLKLKRIQCDEIWSFVYAKQKDVRPEMLEHGHAGDVWTWTAIDAETKLVPSWRLGSRDAHTAKEFINDLASRLATRVQLTTDGHKAYLTAGEGAFGADVDHAMLVKLYGKGQEDESRYSPAECIGAIPTVVTGAPNPEHISARTSLCACVCGGLPRLRMRSPRRLRITRQPWRCTSCTITSSESTRHCVVRQLWPSASQIGSGRFQRWWNWRIRKPRLREIMHDDYKDWQDRIFQKIDELARLEGQTEKKLRTEDRETKRLIERAAKHSAVALGMTLEEARAWVIAGRKKRGLPT